MDGCHVNHRATLKHHRWWRSVLQLGNGGLNLAYRKKRWHMRRALTAHT